MVTWMYLLQCVYYTIWTITVLVFSLLQVPSGCFLASALRRATYDKFGEEGLKAGVTTAEGGT